MRLHLLAALAAAASAWGANTATVVSAATFRAGALAPESIASAFGSNLATTAQSASSTALPTSLAGTQVTVRDSAGASRAATLYYVSAAQVNFVIPAGAAAGAATVTISSGDGTVSSAAITIAPVAPALFISNGTVAAIAVLVKADGAQTSSVVTTAPVDPGGPGDSLVLALYGTGIRGRGSLDRVTCTIGGSVAPVLYAGPQTQYPGLDQVNVLVPRNLGSQPAANVLLTVDSAAANPVRVAMEPRPLGDTRPRATAIAGQMSLDEKIQALHGIQDATHYRTVPGLARLGIPALNITNGPAGATNGGPGHQGAATALPAPVALAATWDIGLARLYGSIVGLEARDLANGFLEGPDINLVRVPQNGRAFEAYGEDPYLAGQISAAFIQGVQSEGVIAEAKHYAGNNQEINRGTINDLIDERTLREIYLPAFEASVKQGGVDGVMCAYNLVNGAYSCENDLLMNQILKNEWAFRGFTTSDFGAVHSTVPSANAGLDVEMPTGVYFTGALQSAVQAGTVPMASIDDKLVRRFSTMMRYGIFDAPPVNQPLPTGQDGLLARRIAQAGMVLLKNDGRILPLNAAQLRSMAVIGPYAARAKTGGGGSSLVVPAYTVDPVPAIQARAGLTASYASGSDITQAVTIAKTADVAIVMVGDDETEGTDHPIGLSGTQDALVTAVAAANPKTVVVVKSGSAVLMPWAASVPAILEAWYPGEEDGNAVAAVLFGDQNPSGKLPVTFPQAVADLPANTPEQYPGVNGIANYSEGVFVGYRHFDSKGIPPLFPFGHGLSYSTFAYGNLTVSPVRAGEVSLAFTVTNTGAVAGGEVAQVYVGMPSSAVPQPPKQLKAFSKVFLEPGESAELLLTLDSRAFSYWDVASHGWKVALGTYQIMVGSSSRDIRLQGQVSF